MGPSQNARYPSRPWAYDRDTLIHTLWYCMIHTLDPYPCSIPLSCWRMTDVGPNAAFCPNTASGPGTATTVATTTAASAAPAASTARSRAAATAAAATAAAAAAAATISHLPPRSCCYCLSLLLLLVLLVLLLLVLVHFLCVLLVVGQVQLPSNTARYCKCTLEANKTFLAALGASCASCGAMITTPSVAALPGTCRTRLEISRNPAHSRSLLSQRQSQPR